MALMARSASGDPFDLARFVTAQEAVYLRVCRELREARKVTHWMWFVFPQAEGLGQSRAAQEYAIRSLAEARAYLDHPILGYRLLECVDLLLRVQGSSASDIFGYPDDLKLRSSMTLFAIAAEERAPFEGVLERYFDSEADRLTVAIVRRWEGVG
jgi:uncharacterized protein (DUF1810 family)